jgi:hypothetical protein
MITVETIDEEQPDLQVRSTQATEHTETERSGRVHADRSQQ